MMKNKKIKSLTDWGFLVDDAYESGKNGGDEERNS